MPSRSYELSFGTSIVKVGRLGACKNCVGQINRLTQRIFIYRMRFTFLSECFICLDYLSLLLNVMPYWKITFVMCRISCYLSCL